MKKIGSILVTFDHRSLCWWHVFLFLMTFHLEMVLRVTLSGLPGRLGSIMNYLPGKKEPDTIIAVDGRDDNGH